jgi:hypothetical protein
VIPAIVTPMSPLIDVDCWPADDAGWRCRVTVTEGTSSTAYDVSVSAADLARLAPGAEDPVDLVRRSFAFLLAREPAGSILRRFDLAVIGHYFPEYERSICDAAR